MTYNGKKELITVRLNDRTLRGAVVTAGENATRREKFLLTLLSIAIFLHLKQTHSLKMHRRDQNLTKEAIYASLKKAGVSSYYARLAGEAFESFPEVFLSLFIERGKSGKYAVRSLKGSGKKAVFYMFREGEERILSFPEVKEMAGYSTRHNLLPFLVRRGDLNVSRIKKIVEAAALVSECTIKKEPIENSGCDKRDGQYGVAATGPIGDGSSVFSKLSHVTQAITLNRSKDAVERLRKRSKEIADVDFITKREHFFFSFVEEARAKMEEINSDPYNDRKAIMRYVPMIKQYQVQVVSTSCMASNSIDVPTVPQWHPRRYYNLLKKVKDCSGEEYRKAQAEFRDNLKRYQAEMVGKYHDPVFRFLRHDRLEDLCDQKRRAFNRKKGITTKEKDEEGKVYQMGTRMFCSGKPRQEKEFFMIYRKDGKLCYWTEGSGKPMPEVETRDMYFMNWGEFFQIHKLYIMYRENLIAFSFDSKELLSKNVKGASGVPGKKFDKDDDEWKGYLEKAEGDNACLKPVRKMNELVREWKKDPGHEFTDAEKVILKLYVIFKDEKPKTGKDKKYVERWSKPKAEEPSKEEEEERKGRITDFENTRASEMMYRESEEAVDSIYENATSKEKEEAASIEKEIWRRLVEESGGNPILAKKKCLNHTMSVRSNPKDERTLEFIRHFGETTVTKPVEMVYRKLDFVMQRDGLLYVIEGFETEKDVKGDIFKERKKRADEEMKRENRQKHELKLMKKFGKLGEADREKAVLEGMEKYDSRYGKPRKRCEPKMRRAGEGLRLSVNGVVVPDERTSNRAYDFLRNMLKSIDPKIFRANTLLHAFKRGGSTLVFEGDGLVAPGTGFIDPGYDGKIRIRMEKFMDGSVVPCDDAVEFTLSDLRTKETKLEEYNKPCFIGYFLPEAIIPKHLFKDERTIRYPNHTGMWTVCREAMTGTGKTELETGIEESFEGRVNTRESGIGMTEEETPHL